MLLFSLVAEGVTGVAVLLAPGFVAALLFGADVAGAGAAYGRVLGLSLLALACWPGAAAPGGTRAALRAMLAYNAVAAAYLAFLGIGGDLTGILLWPAIAEHALVALLLAAAGRRPQAEV